MFEDFQQPKKPLAEMVADNITNLIAEQKLAADSKLPNEFELAQMLGVGRGTVREAVKLLVSRNVLVIKRGKGTYVASNPGVVDDPWGLAFVHDKYKLAMDLLELRLIVEPDVAELAALRATEQDIKELSRLCDEVEEMIANNIPHLSRDVEYHTRIAESTQNQAIPKLIPIITFSIGLFVELTEYALLDETVVTHRQILNAIKERNPAEAKKAMTQHLTYNKNCMANLYDAK